MFFRNFDGRVHGGIPDLTYRDARNLARVHGNAAENAAAQQIGDNFIY
jgi:hypothetical protein